MPTKAGTKRNENCSHDANWNPTSQTVCHDTNVLQCQRGCTETLLLIPLQRLISYLDDLVDLQVLSAPQVQSRDPISKKQKGPTSTTVQHLLQPLVDYESRPNKAARAKSAFGHHTSPVDLNRCFVSDVEYPKVRGGCYRSPSPKLSANHFPSSAQTSGTEALQPQVGESTWPLCLAWSVASCL